ncbi:hypothetical protein N5P18_06865 [Janibacter terrae]|jgi:hypothetical protein|uniref:DUF1795 domain-containing protein n=1 Tax=Janibacter terrae TaxID=103817 RepID=A0ABZ2FGW8_9MICO|nr:hypothetical protein [Janibacter terrae]MBA4084413.1 hypothetical protein [Kytococcus sp.]HCE60807.1 hypothetical protein [Janibacter terrae]
MTTTVTYPSEVVPGPPPIRLEMPDGWTHVWAPETLIAIRDDAQGVDHFLANVVVRYYQRMAPFGGEEIHAELQEYVDARRDGELSPLRSQTVGDREWLGAELAFVDDQAGTVGQAHWFTAQQTHDVLDVIQVTGSYAGSRRETDYAIIDRVVDSIRVNP